MFFLEYYVSLIAKTAESVSDYNCFTACLVHVLNQFMSIHSTFDTLCSCIAAKVNEIEQWQDIPIVKLMWQKSTFSVCIFTSPAIYQKKELL